MTKLIFDNKELKDGGVYGGGFYYAITPATITFSDDSKVEFVMYEDPICDVYNYADLSPINDEPWRELEFESWQIDSEEDGFLLVLNIDALRHKSIYIPCYSDQNDFYSDEVIAVVYDESGNITDKLGASGYAL